MAEGNSLQPRYSWVHLKLNYLTISIFNSSLGNSKHGPILMKVQ